MDTDTQEDASSTAAQFKNPWMRDLKVVPFRGVNRHAYVGRDSVRVGQHGYVATAVLMRQSTCNDKGQEAVPFRGKAATHVGGTASVSGSMAMLLRRFLMKTYEFRKRCPFEV